MPLFEAGAGRRTPAATIGLLCRCGVVAALFFGAGTAFAHGDAGIAGGFASGFGHPLRGLDHLLAMVAVGLWGAFLGRPLNYVLPVVFPAIMAAGGVLGMLNIFSPPVELGIGFSVLALGAFVAAGRRLAAVPAILLVSVFALFHGFAHGQELPITADPVGYSAGFVLSTGLLHIAGIALGLLAHGPERLRYLPRILGGLITLAGVWFLCAALMQ